jgi:hypothetical protein
MNDKLNKLFMRIPKRSESEDRETLVKTFVDLDPLVTLISVKDHQVIYGRRGTGKDVHIPPGAGRPSPGAGRHRDWAEEEARK